LFQQTRCQVRVEGGGGRPIPGAIKKFSGTRVVRKVEPKTLKERKKGAERGECCLFDFQKSWEADVKPSPTKSEEREKKSDSKEEKKEGIGRGEKNVGRTRNCDVRSNPEEGDCAGEKGRTGEELKKHNAAKGVGGLMFIKRTRTRGSSPKTPKELS